jgi:hypothetical protein
MSHGSQTTKASSVIEIRNPFMCRCACLQRNAIRTMERSSELWKASAGAFTGMPVAVEGSWGSSGGSLAESLTGPWKDLEHLGGLLSV